MDKNVKLTKAKEIFDDTTYEEYKVLLEASLKGSLRPVKRPRFADLSFELEKSLKSEATGAKNNVLPANKSTLDDGTHIEWFSEIVEADEVEAKTFVIEENNGRPQSLLTEFSLSLMTHSIRKNCQFYPAYGYRHSDGRIEIIDGSRRRMSCIFGKTNFLVYVTDYQLTPQQIKELRIILQSGREAALYDIGMDCLTLKKQGCNGKQIAQFLNLSESKVSRAKSAALAPLCLLKLFNDYSVLSASQYTLLANIHNDLKEAKGLNVLDEGSESLLAIQAEVKKIVNIDDTEKHAAAVLKTIKFVSKQLTNKETDLAKSTPRAKNLLSNMKTSHRLNLSRKVDSKGHEKVVYELSRMDQKTLDKFEKVVESFLREHYEN